SDEFRKDSLQFFPGLDSYFLPFSTEQLSNEQIQKDSTGHYNHELVLQNIIGVLPGKIKPEEVIIFSAHYDHMGVIPGEGIYNGANDDASGTTAVLELAHYYSMRNDNERTLIFCTFAGEELGLYGSIAFVPYIKPEKVVADINIEMIGRQLKNNSFFITGTWLSDFEGIMKKNLEGQKIKIIKDPDLSKRLFWRSDNYSFAKKGIPSHSIMSSNDSDPCYHQPCDDVRTIDIERMTNIIKAITVGVRTIVDGTDTPSRINLKELNK
ncbi:MAG: M28 family metallopeptidase, partial [Flavisolibacter sp.]